MSDAEQDATIALAPPAAEPSHDEDNRLTPAFVDEVIHVEEADTIRMCHTMARRGYLFGGSTGTVVSAATEWLAAHDGEDLTAVALSRDRGERYLETIYPSNWVADLYGDDVLTSHELATSQAAWPGRSSDE